MTSKLTKEGIIQIFYESRDTVSGLKKIDKIVKQLQQELAEANEKLKEKDERIKELNKYEQESHTRDDEIDNKWESKVQEVIKDFQSRNTEVVLESGCVNQGRIIKVILDDLLKELLSKQKGEQ